MKKFMAVLCVLVLVLSLSAVAFASEPEVMSYDDFKAAEMESEVVVEANIQAVQVYNEEYGNTSLYLQDPDGGAYFVYRLACTPEEYATFEVGKKIRITGYKTEWSGEVEIADASFELVDGEEYVAEAIDVTELLGKDELIDNLNCFVCFKDMTVEPSDNAGEQVAFLYNWDGSGEEGNDLYFNVSKNGETYNFTVETDLCSAESDVYQAVKNLKIGDVVDLEGFLYWYNGPNPQITACAAAE